MAQIGICSWSLRPSGPDDLVHKVRACGLNAVQVALDPIRRGEWDERVTIDMLKAEGIAILSGMMAMRGEDYSTLESIKRSGGVRLDKHWPENLAAAFACAALARRMGIKLVTFHAGFLPHDSSDVQRRTMIARLREIADAFAAQDVAVAFETGQESAATLTGVLHELEHPSIGVNFDPANMILYGMGDPITSFAALSKWVRQVHIKDATPTATPGMWGTEMVVGKGVVDWPAFMKLVRQRTPRVNLLIERESRLDDAQKVADICAAHSLIRKLLDQPSE